MPAATRARTVAASRARSVAPCAPERLTTAISAVVATELTRVQPTPSAMPTASVSRSMAAGGSLFAQASPTQYRLSERAVGLGTAGSASSTRRTWAATGAPDQASASRTPSAASSASKVCPDAVAARSARP